MPASNHTNNLSLPIYAAEDHVSILGDFNEAMRTLDSEVSAAVQAGNSASTDAANALAAANAASEAATRAKDSADSTLTTAASAQAAASQAATAVADLRTRVASAETNASNAVSVANAAESAASSAASQATTALSQANSAVNVAGGVDSKAQEALDTANTISGETADLRARSGYLRTFSGGSGSYTPGGSGEQHNIVTANLTGLIVGQVYYVNAYVTIRHANSTTMPPVELTVLKGGVAISPTLTYADYSYNSIAAFGCAFRADSETATLTLRSTAVSASNISIIKSQSHLYVS